MKKHTHFTIYFWFVSWDDISLGISLSWRYPHIELHIPFGFLKVGWDSKNESRAANWDSVKWRKKTLI